MEDHSHKLVTVDESNYRTDRHGTSWDETRACECGYTTTTECFSPANFAMISR